MKSYFFNAEPTDDLVNHPTGYDREYDADDHADFFAPFFTKAGVMAGCNADTCKVVVDQGATLRVLPGQLYVRGRMAIFDGTDTIDVTEDCTIVARMNKSADVRAFQLLAVQELLDTEDICDLPLAQATVTPVLGGFDAAVTDLRTFMAFTGQPPYYPPDPDGLPYVLWLYVMGLPMTAEQRASVEDNPSLMEIFHASLGAGRSSTVNFAAQDWTQPVAGGRHELRLTMARHGRPGPRFGYTVRHQLESELSDSTWAVRCTGAVYDEESGDIVLHAPCAYSGQVVFFAS